MWRTLRRLITASAVITGVYFFIIRPAERFAEFSLLSTKRNLAAALESVTGRTTHTTNGQAVLTDHTEISELALLELRMSTTRTIEKTESFAGLSLGTKKLVVRGHYRVKSGYKLSPGVSLTNENGRTIARFPAPEILSVELLNHETLTEESGWLNRIHPADREQILRELRAQMKADAMASGLPQMADATLRTRLRDLLGNQDVTLERPLR